MHRPAVSIAVALLAATVTSLATASPAGMRVIGTASASGDFAAAVATGSAKRPTALYLRILASPRQRVTGNYATVCTKNSGAGSKSGQFAGTAPERVTAQTAKSRRLTRQRELPVSTTGNDLSACAVPVTGTNGLRPT